MGKHVENWLYVLCFIDLFGVSLIVPVFGLYLRSIGFSHSVIGMISSVYSAVQLGSSPVVGSWSDTYGRKPVLLVTQLVCAVAYLMFTLTNSFILILLVRVVLGLMKHTQTICKASVADYIQGDKQTEIQGKMTGIAALGFMLGPVIGGHIAEMDNGFLYICYITSFMFVVNSLIVLFWFPVVENQRKVNNLNTTMTSSVYKIVIDLLKVDWKHYWDVFSLKFILGIALSLFYSNYYLFVEDTFKVTPKYIGYTVSFQGLVSAVSGMLIKYFNNLYKDNYIGTTFLKVYHCFIILTMSFLVIYLSTNIYVFQLCLLPLSGATSLIRIITTELLLVRSDEMHRGSLMGAANSVSSSTRMIAPILTGFVQDVAHSSNVIVLGFLLSFCGIFISHVLRSKYSKSGKIS